MKPNSILLILCIITILSIFRRLYKIKKSIHTTKQNKENKDSKREDNFVDITDEWFANKEAKKNYKAITTLPEMDKVFNYKGRIYINDKVTSVFRSSNLKEEYSFGVWLNRTFNEDVKMLPEIIKPKYVQTPDYLFKGEY